MVFLSLLFVFPLYAAEQRLMLGESEIRVRIAEYGNGPSFVLLHSNETTAQRVGENYAARCGGRYIALVNNNKRNVSFILDGVRYIFDPNRIFSEKGIAATLSQHGPYSFEAHKEVRLLADTLLLEMVRSNLVIALHNNTDGGYGVSTYDTGGAESINAQAVHMETSRDVDNFFLVTESGHYDILRARGQNVVLQARHPFDDGSLSAFAARRGWAYVNIEVQHGQHAIQDLMVSELITALHSCGG